MRLVYYIASQGWDASATSGVERGDILGMRRVFIGKNGLIKKGRFWFNAGKIVVDWTVHSAGNFNHFHFVRRAGLEDSFQGFFIVDPTVEPGFAGLVGKDNWHAVMRLYRYRVWNGGDDGASDVKASVGVVPFVVQPGHHEGPVVLVFDVEGLFFAASFFAAPFEISVGRNEATLAAEGAFPGRLACDGFAAGVDEAELGGVLGPVGNEAPEGEGGGEAVVV